MQRPAGLSLHRNLTLRTALVLTFLVLTGCSATQSDFARTASDTGSAFAAAATTLAYVHQGKLTGAYARSAFVNYRDELQGTAQQLPGLSGAPGLQTVRRLTRLYAAAERAVTAPCLEGSCDWRAQVAALQHASHAFLKAADA